MPEQVTRDLNVKWITSRIEYTSSLPREDRVIWSGRKVKNPMKGIETFSLHHFQVKVRLGINSIIRLCLTG